MKKESYAKVNEDGSLSCPYDKYYGLEHLAIDFVKSINLDLQNVHKILSDHARVFGSWVDKHQMRLDENATRDIIETRKKIQNQNDIQDDDEEGHSGKKKNAVMVNLRKDY